MDKVNGTIEELKEYLHSLNINCLFYMEYREKPDRKGVWGWKMIMVKPNKVFKSIWLHKYPKFKDVAKCYIDFANEV